MKDVEYLRSLIERAIKIRGEDFVYTETFGRTEDMGCYYVETGKDGNQIPGCVIGYALHLDGMSLSSLEEAEGYDAMAVLEVSGFTEQAGEFGNMMQIEQDCGDSWGEAYSKTIKKLGA